MYPLHINHSKKAAIQSKCMSLAHICAYVYCSLRKEARAQSLGDQNVLEREMDVLSGGPLIGTQRGGDMEEW